MVAMEVFQQVRWALTKPEALFEVEIVQFLSQVGALSD